MNTNLKTQNLERTYRVWLYSVVFAGKFSAAAVLVLFLSFFIQPFHRALANEALSEEVTESGSVAEDVKVQPEELVELSEDDKSLVEDKAIIAETPAESVATTDESQDETAPVNVGGTLDDAEKEFMESPPDLPIETEALDVGTSTTSEIEPDIPTDDPPVATSSSPTDVSSTSVQINLPESRVIDSGSSTVSTTTEPEGEVLGESTATSSVLVVDDTGDVSSSTSEASSSDNSDNNSTETAEEDFAVSDNSDSSESGTTANSGADIENITDNAVSSNNNAQDYNPATSQTATSSATSTVIDSVPETITQAEYIVTEENYYQFSRQSCVAVGDGTYHCSLNTDKPIDENTVVYADNDAGGDMEIYIKTSGDKVEKLTDNDYDDTAPHLDADSMQVVWQRMVNGRYQIISYDLAEGIEAQLTFSATNNMEPKISSAGIVWQAWDENDWEIMYFDGSYTEQITDNDAQDVTPAIEDGYILWSILGGSNQEARVHSLESRQTMTISGHDGGVIDNPRFVLVYDTKFDNGDVVTQSFDPDTGLSELIAAQPYSEPIKIPPVDTTGEIKALIQNKSNQKEDLATEGVQHNIDGSPSVDDLATTSAATSTDVLNLKPADGVPADMFELEAVSTTTVEAEQPPLELTEFDLVIVSTTTPVSVAKAASVSTDTASSTQE